MRRFRSSSHRGGVLICLLPLPALLLRVYAGLTVEARGVAPAFWSSGRRRVCHRLSDRENERERARSSRTGEVAHWPLGPSGRVSESDMVRGGHGAGLAASM